MTFTVVEKDGIDGSKYWANVDVEHAIFYGTGQTEAEAVGRCLIANRELLGVSISVSYKPLKRRRKKK